MLGELLERSPRQIGPYRVLARLGAGGMGEVYLGADTRPAPRPPTSGTTSLAAVKVVRADLLASGGPAFRDRFRREISTARAVEGRFTARLLTGDADAPAPWLATEYVAGPTLERAVRESGPLPADTVRGLGLSLVRALRGIHHARVLHRDLKPANVLLGADGPRVIDFGIARDFGASTLTATGAMVGSPGYMSPEHVLGGRHVVSASDVFSLASVLCYAATGEGPFGTGPVAAVLYRVSQAEARLDAVPAELRALIEDCLRADPSARPDAIELEARFRDAGAPDPVVWPAAIRAQVALYEGELARAVEAAGTVAGRVPTMPGAAPVHSAPTVTGPSREPRPQPPSTRRRRTTILAVVAGALTIGVLGAFGIRALQDVPDPKSPPSEAGSEPDPPAALVGLDKHGVDRGRHFPVDPAARPQDWQPWTAKLSGRPWDCALSSDILVCRMFYGGLEAVGAADGKPRWKVPSAEPGAPPTLGASSGMYIPGDATNPVIYGDSVLSAEGGMVHSRSLKEGTEHWKQPLKGDGTVRLANVGEALVGGGVAFFATRGERTEIHAFDADTGEPLWKRALSTYVGVEVGYGGFGPEAFAGGRVLASTDGGLTGFDARTGKPTPFTVPGEDGGNCVGVRVMGGEVLCGIEGKGSVVLNAETLRQTADGPHASPPDWQPEDLVTVGADTYVLAPDEKSTRMELLNAYDDAPVPRTVGNFLPAPKDGQYLYSEASVVGTTAVFLDNEFLYTLPVTGDAQTGTRTRIEGAPGNRSGSGLGDGRHDVDNQVWEPELISVGGVLFLMYHDGTVRSMELPT
ncbi:protein kinase domain-containing protein [Streptomyces sp. NBC_01506]|uniref:protein kinase domain-containing protein n=1 Tax=Streptomyces sp. NBC_01506 TaxID=2903887 RepID=UPI00386CE769